MLELKEVQEKLHALNRRFEKIDLINLYVKINAAFSSASSGDTEYFESVVDREIDKNSDLLPAEKAQIKTLIIERLVINFRSSVNGPLFEYLLQYYRKSIIESAKTFLSSW